MSIDPIALLTGADSLPDDEVAIRDTVRAFGRDRLSPYVADWFEQARFPREVVKEFGALGVLGMHLTGYGCAGTSALAYGLACMELEAVDSGFRSFVSVQGSLAMFAIRRFGSEEQRQRWLPSMAAGDAIGCFGLTEPDFGSNPAGMRTTARRDGSDWVLNGTKMWITNGTIADVAVVWARTEAGVRGFVVPTTAAGFTAHEITRKLSLRVSATAELVLDECRLPARARLPEASGLRAALSCLDEARFGVLFGALGAARTCLQTALDYAGMREQFGQPIAGFQLTQEKLTGIALELAKGYLLALNIARLKDAGTATPVMVSAGKLNNVREALAAARAARTILGANGISLEYPVLRHANNLESVLTYEGTSEIHTLVLGQALTGLSAFTSERTTR